MQLEKLAECLFLLAVGLVGVNLTIWVQQCTQVAFVDHESS